MNDKVIDELTKCVDDMITEHKNQFGDMYKFYRICNDCFNDTNTTFHVSLNLYGFMYDIIYVFECDNDTQCDKVFVYSYDRECDIMSCDVSNDNDFYLHDMINALSMYAWLVHVCDSCGTFDLLV